MCRRTIIAALTALQAGPDLPDSIARGEIQPGVRSLHVGRRGRRGRHFVLYRSIPPGTAEVLSIQVLSLAPTPTVYKRKYLVRGDAFNREEDSIDFDVVTELAFPDRESFVAWIEKLSGEAIGRDEQKFLDRSRTRAYVIEEHVTAG